MTNTSYCLIIAQLVLIGLPIYVLDRPWVRDPRKLKGWSSWCAFLLMLTVGLCPFLAFLNLFLLGEEFQRILLQSRFIRSAAGFVVALGISWLIGSGSISVLRRFGLIR